MEIKTSFSKASRIPETVSRLINEEFVLVYQQLEDASGKYEELQLKVPDYFKCVVFSNGDDQLEKAMEEILRDSEKDQNNFPALRGGSSEAGDGVSRSNKSAISAPPFRPFYYRVLIMMMGGKKKP